MTARRLVRKRSGKRNLPPGTLVHIGDHKTDPVSLRVMDYTQEKLEELVLDRVDQVRGRKDDNSVTWFNIDGLHDTKTIEQTGELFAIHPLVLADIVNTDQRPKYEPYDDFFFVVLKMLHWDVKNGTAHSEQVSLVVGEKFLLSFQERPGDVFDSVRERIRTSSRRIRRSGPDYLAYSLMSAVVDNYFLVVEHLGEQIEKLENEVLTDPTPATQQKIYAMKQELMHVRRSVWPLREVASALSREDSKMIAEENSAFMRDLFDHAAHVVETIEMFRDTVSGLMDLYLSYVSNRMNEVMKVLTIIATIFIPLTFIAGIYGMNFENMPELKAPWAYPAVWVVMILVTGAMLWFFRKKRWL